MKKTAAFLAISAMLLAVAPEKIVVFAKSMSSKAVREMVRKKAMAYGLDPALVLLIGMAESDLTPGVRDGKAGEKGMFQIKLSVFRLITRSMGYKKTPNPHDPVINTAVACHHLRSMRKCLGKHGNDKRLVALAYNQGNGYVSRQLKKKNPDALLRQFRNHPAKIYRMIFRSKRKDLKDIRIKAHY